MLTWLPARPYLHQLFRTKDELWKTCRDRQMIGTDRERECGKSVLAAQLDDDNYVYLNSTVPDGWGCWICQLHLCRKVRTPSPPTSVLDMTPKVFRIYSIPLSLLLPDLLWPGVVVTVWVPTMRQIELFNHLTVRKQMTNVKLIRYCHIIIETN